MYHLSDTGVIATDYLLYHYYGALVYIALKQYPKALRMLEAAITTPTNVPDAIIVCAWQRYQIITALLTGAQPTGLNAPQQW
jgi:COP9 signalosome complex subunit 3